MLLFTLVIALVLAWPTYGLSLVGWALAQYVHAKLSGNSFKRMEARRAHLTNRYFGGECRGEFVRLLTGKREDDGPLIILRSQETKLLEGTLIRFIATHPELYNRFITLVDNYLEMAESRYNAPNGSAALALRMEMNRTDMGGPLALFVYSAIATLCENNPEHSVISKIDKLEVATTMDFIKMTGQHERILGGLPFAGTAYG